MYSRDIIDKGQVLGPREMGCSIEGKDVAAWRALLYRFSDQSSFCLDFQGFSGSEIRSGSKMDLAVEREYARVAAHMHI